MENDENLEQEEVKKSYDVAGLLIGAFFGLIFAIIGITDVLMGIVVGMFFGLVIGTFIKKK